MRLYEKHILPRLTHLAMGQDQLLPYRRRAISGLHGRVLEMGEDRDNRPEPLEASESHGSISLLICFDQTMPSVSKKSADGLPIFAGGEFDDWFATVFVPFCKRKRL